MTRSLVPDSVIGTPIHRSRRIRGGALVFVGTRVSVEHVGALVRQGVTVAELNEDYPQLTVEDFELAARLLVRSRRPRPLARLAPRRASVR
jgi:uncharacterized protein (DUF433 family)